MGRFLRITVVVLLVIAVWAILVAPDYDLDPTTLRAKLAIAVLLCAVVVLTRSFRSTAVRLRDWNAPPEAVPSILDLTCSLLC